MRAGLLAEDEGMWNHRSPLACGLLFLVAGCVADAQNVLPPAAPEAKTNEQKAVAAIKKAWGKVEFDKGNPSAAVSVVNPRFRSTTLTAIGPSGRRAGVKTLPSGSLK